MNSFRIPHIVLAAALLAGAAPGAPVRVTIDASQKEAPVSRYLFGKFTEHLGRNVYQGAWAQILLNPEFVPPQRWPDARQLDRRLRAAATEFGLTKLTEAPGAGIAPYWIADGDVKGQLLGRGIRDIQQLVIGAGGGSLRTGVFLPLHRVRSFEVMLKARSEPAGECRVVVQTTAGRVLGEARLRLSPGWTERQCRINVRGGPTEKGAAYLLRLDFPRGSSVELERALLFPTDNLDGWDPEVVDYMKKARLPMLRFPGGNFSSGYHWEDGVGSLDRRPVRPNPAWPIVEWNHVGTDEWLRLCELTGAEPLICVNAGNGTPEEARHWVEYVNGPADSEWGRKRAANGHPRPYHVRYWEIGNELYGAWQIGHTDGAGYAARYGNFVAAMRKADPDILFIANGQRRALLGSKLRDQTPGWNQALVEENGRMVRSISVHSLEGSGIPADADPVEVWKEFVAFADGYLDYLEALVGEPMRRAGLTPRAAVTEMQIFTRHPSLPTNKTIAEPLWLASLLNTCIRSHGLVELVTHSALLNHGGGLRKERSLVFADPAWWATHLYGSQPGIIPVAVQVEGPTFSTAGRWTVRRSGVPYLDVTGLLDPAGSELNLLVVNRHPESALETELTVKGFDAARQAALAWIAADSLLVRNSWREPENVALQKGATSIRDGVIRYTFPSLSLTRITLRARRR